MKRATLTMRRLAAALIMAAAALSLCALSWWQAEAQGTRAKPAEEQPEDYPDAPNREDTFYFCTACHGFKIVAQQGMTRTQWDDSLNWMTTRHGMHALEGDERKLILNYLETHYPPSAPAGGRGSPNPFLK